jgi:hypothetical protein
MIIDSDKNKKDEDVDNVTSTTTSKILNLFGRLNNASLNASLLESSSSLSGYCVL